jgi:hypothetical protein
MIWKQDEGTVRGGIRRSDPRWLSSPAWVAFASFFFLSAVQQSHVWKILCSASMLPYLFSRFDIKTNFITLLSMAHFIVAVARGWSIDELRPYGYGSPLLTCCISFRISALQTKKRLFERKKNVTQFCFVLWHGKAALICSGSFWEKTQDNGRNTQVFHCNFRNLELAKLHKKPSEICVAVNVREGNKVRMLCRKICILM